MKKAETQETPQQAAPQPLDTMTPEQAVVVFEDCVHKYSMNFTMKTDNPADVAAQVIRRNAVALSVIKQLVAGPPAEMRESLVAAAKANAKAPNGKAKARK